MTAPHLASRIPRDAAKHRLAASSVAPVASRHPLTRTRVRPCEACFSRPVIAICSEGGLQ